MSIFMRNVLELMVSLQCVMMFNLIEFLCVYSSLVYYFLANVIDVVGFSF